MRKARTLLILFLLAMVAIAAALMFFTEKAPLRQADREDAQPGTGVQQETAAQQDAETGQPAAAKEDTSRPTFDVVRVEKDGSVVMAGQAEAGATVIVRSGTTEIGRTTADDNGEWILQQDRKLDPREHGIELSSQSPDGERTLFSKQRLALSLSDPKRGEPLVALTEEGKSTRVLQMPSSEMLSELTEAKAGEGAAVASVDDLPETAIVPATPEAVTGANAPAEGETPPADASEPVVGFASVDYEDADQKSMVYISGVGTPGSRVAIYIDNVFAGFVVADASGSWSFADNRQLEGGSHILRADVLDKSSNAVVARAEVNFDRQPTSDSRTALFDQGSKITEDDGVDIATAEPDTAGASAKTKVIVVKRGDTLWHIAEQYYGDGARYTQIFRNNRNQIRNPHRIYPEQEFVVPNDLPAIAQ